MGDLGVKTIPVLLPTRLTALATNTTLGTATEYSTSATVNMPETTRRIRHVEIVVTARDGQTTATDWDGCRVGVQVNAVAFSDTDYTVTAANTGDHTTYRLKSFPTPYFQTNDPGTATWTIGVRVRFQNAAASNVNNVTICAWITYEHDSTAHASGGATTTVKHAMFPIQSSHNNAQITTTYTEIGRASAAPAPANQIPQLTGAGDPELPEASVSIKQYWLEVIGTEGATGTTDHVFSYRVDGATDNARHTTEQALSSNPAYYDLFDLSTAAAGGGALSTTAAHAFEIKCDTAGNTLELPGAILHVVYTYDADASTTKALQSIRVPLSNITGGNRIPPDAADRAMRYSAGVHVQEPGPIVMRQSGVVVNSTFNNLTTQFAASGQTARGYVFASSSVRDFQAPIVHRCDHNLSVWDLMRGHNDLIFEIYNGADTDDFAQGAYAIVNYHSGISPQGTVAHACTTVWPIAEYVERTFVDTASTTPSQAPFIPPHGGSVNGTATECDYTNFGSFVEVWAQATAPGVQIGAKRVAGEGPGAGWNVTEFPRAWLDAAEMGTKIAYHDTSRWWHANGFGGPDGSFRGLFQRDKLDVTCPGRIWYAQQFSSGSTPGICVSFWMTHHTHRHALSASYTINGADAADDTEVDVVGYDPGTKEVKFMRTVLVASGVFSATVYDDTLVYCAHGRDASFPGSSETGYVQRNGGNTEAPKVVARGTARSTTTGEFFSYNMPGDPLRIGDLMVLFIQGDNGEDYTDYSGSAAPDSPQDGTTTRLEVFAFEIDDVSLEWGNYFARLGAILGTPQDPTDHFLNPGPLILRGVDTSDIFDVTEGGTAASNTAVSITGDTTTVPNTCVLAAVANSTDTATLQGSGFANANLAGLHQVASFNTTDGIGGGVDVAAGSKATASAIGATTATLASASAHAKWMGAFKPRTYPTADFDIVVGTIGGGGGATRPIGSPLVRRFQ